MVIDHAVGHGLSACDQVYDTELRFSAGYLFNFAGKLKQARLLLAALAKHGIVVRARRTRSVRRRAWNCSCRTSRPSRILSAEESEKVREDLFSDGDWKLSLPAGATASR